MSWNWNNVKLSDCKHEYWIPTCANIARYRIKKIKNESDVIDFVVYESQIIGLIVEQGALTIKVLLYYF